MYQPPIFREERSEVMHSMMTKHPFASLVSVQAGEIVADHIPLVLHPELSTNGVLRGHVARANPLAKNLDHSFVGLAMFQGAHHYITPSWYPSKKEHEKVVPTWNYIVVHARGQIKIHEDTDWLLSHLTELTNRQEKVQDDPWKVSDAPDEYLARQLRGIVGIEIEITSLQGTWKASQNKTSEDSLGVSEGLKAEASEIAAAMSIGVDAGRLHSETGQSHD